MRAYRLLHQLVLRFSAMDDSEALSLNSEAETDYMKVLNDARITENLQKNVVQENLIHDGQPGYPKAVPVLKPNQKIILLCEKWYARYGFAIAFIVLVPVIKRFMDGGVEEETENEGDAAEFARAFMMYSRHKKI